MSREYFVGGHFGLAGGYVSDDETRDYFLPHGYVSDATVAGPPAEITGTLATTEIADGAAFTGSIPAPVTVYTPSPALTTTNANTGINFRQLVQLSAASNGQLQVRFRAGTAGLAISGAAFGKWDGSALSSVNCNMTTAPFRLTFGGSNATTVPSNSTTTSDLIAHTGVTLSSGDWVIVTYFVAGTGPGDEVFSSGHTTALTYFRAVNSDLSQDQNGTGYSESGSAVQPGGANGRNFSVDLVETNAAVGIVQTGSNSDYALNNSSASGTVSSTITVPADAEIVTVALSGYSGSTDIWSGMTFPKGGVDTAMTKVTRVSFANNWNCSMFYLVSPDTGTNKTLKWSWSGGAPDPSYAYSVTFWKGIDLASPVRDSDIANGSSFPRSTKTLTAQSGDKIVAFAGFFYSPQNGAGEVTAWSNLTELAEITHAAYSEGAWAIGDPTGNVAVGVTSCTGSEGGIAAVVLKPAVAAGDVTGTLVATEAADAAVLTGTVGWPAITGTLATTEAGDGAAVTGNVSWLAILAAPETGDSASATALVYWFGTLAVVETADGAAFSGAIIGTGTLAASEAADTAALAASVRWQAALAASETADGAAFTGTVLSVVTGTLATTETSDDATMAGDVSGGAVRVAVSWVELEVVYNEYLGNIVGSLLAVETGDTASGTGSVRWLVTLAASEAADAASFTASIVGTGTLAATEAPDDATFDAAIVASGILAATETGDDATFAGGIYATGTLAATEAADSFAAAGLVLSGLTAILSATEAADAAQLSGQVTGVAGALAATETADSAAIAAQAHWLGTLAASEARDTAAFSGAIVASGILAATEAPDVFAGVGGIVGAGVNANLAVIETPDDATMAGAVTGFIGTLAASETGDTASMSASVRSLVTLQAIEAPDAAAFTAELISTGTLAATEAPDDATFTGALVASGTLAATEAPDTFAAGALVLPPTGAILAALEAADDATFSGLVTGVAGTLVVSEAPDRAAILAQTRWLATLQATEAADTASGSATVRWLAILDAIETPDSAAILVEVSTSGELAASEAPDDASFAGGVRIDGALAATEAADVCAMSVRLFAPNTLTAFEEPDIARFNSGRITQHYQVIAQDNATPEVTGRKIAIPEIAAQSAKPLAVTGRRNRPASITGQRTAPSNWDAQA